MHLSTLQIGWIAGILEGEGSFGLTNNKTTPCIWLGMTDKDTVEKLRDLIDPSQDISISEDNRKDTYKPVYRLTLNNKRAVGWMMTIYSLMSERRKAKIRECLTAWKQFKPDESKSRNPETTLIRFIMETKGVSKEDAYKLLIGAK
jgi:hypothetical protein